MNPWMLFMNRFSKPLLILIFLQFTLSLSSQPMDDDKAMQSDPYESVYTLALALQTDGHLSQACTEFKRYLFMLDYLEIQDQLAASKTKTQAFIHLSECYEQLGNTDLAIDYLLNAINQTTGTDLPALQLRHIRLLSKQYTVSKRDITTDYRFSAYLLLDGYNDSVKKAAAIAHLYNMIIINKPGELSPWYESYIQQYPSLFTEDEKTAFKENLDALLAFSPKNPKLAGYLSLLPGLGQLYAQDYKDALNAFLLNGSLIAVSTWSLISMNFWDFSLLELNPTLRFYRGNLINAQKDTYQYNNKKTLQLSKPLLEILQTADSKI